MKVIFLDFDGVIITYRSHFARRFYNDKKWGNVDGELSENDYILFKKELSKLNSKNS